MKFFPPYIAILLIAPTLVGCCPNGCFIVTGEAFRKAANPTPYFDQWEKTGATKEQLLQASAECGGGSGDRPGFSEDKIAKVRQPGDSWMDAHTRAFIEYERCLVSRGFKFTGPCYNNDISRRLPRCGAP